MKILLVLGVVAACAAIGGLAPATAGVALAARGKARAVVLTQIGATEAELLAARDLRDHLATISGATFDLRTNATDAVGPAIVVGPGPLAARLFPDVDLGRLGAEELVIKTAGDKLLLAGGRPRGTLYAVYRFLQDTLGVRWWTPWATRVPRRATLTIGNLDVRDKPAFESRDPFWFPAFDGTWAIRNGSNSQHARITPEMGGKIVYKGFVHTFFPLIPPAEYFAPHPDWFSLIKGVRTHAGAQLCTTNPELRAELVERLRAWLREAPDARIVSISQNDWAGPCECAPCKAIDDREGSHAGTMVDLLNHVADKLGSEFPNVAFDTLAYQYTRKAPKSLRPRPNVIIRLCSIECNFAAPLTDPSNQAFARDIVDWNRICDRLYIWDYTTNFAHYVMPHPNYFSLGPNVRFFHEHGVKGLFEQGAYQSHGSEMSELRAWVLARLLWNPALDDRKLINEFLDGYYGRPAARHLRTYIELMSRAAKGSYMGCFASPNAPYLSWRVLSKAEQIMQQAEEAARPGSEEAWRVRQARLPLWYAWLTRWTQLRRDCMLAGAVWPVPTSRKALAAQWLVAATQGGPQGWSPMTHVNEGGLTPQAFAGRFAEDPPEPKIEPLPGRAKNPPPPPGLPTAGAVDVQDSRAQLAGEWTWAETRADPTASDGIAVYMPSTHNEWAFQVRLDRAPVAALPGKWQVYVLVRIEAGRAAGEGAAFTAGVWDTTQGQALGSISVSAAGASGAYRPYLLGTVEAAAGRYIWVAPAANPTVKAIWVDRVWLVRAP